MFLIFGILLVSAFFILMLADRVMVKNSLGDFVLSVNGLFVREFDEGIRLGIFVSNIT